MLGIKWKYLYSRKRKPLSNFDRERSSLRSDLLDVHSSTYGSDTLLIITTRCQPLRHNVEEFIQNHSFFCPNYVEKKKKKKKKKNWASLGLVGVKFLGENKFLGGVFLFQNSVRLVTEGTIKKFLHALTFPGGRFSVFFVRN
jgi:hypothetical protein